MPVSLNRLAQFYCDTTSLPKWFWTTVQILSGTQLMILPWSNSIHWTVSSLVVQWFHQTYFQKKFALFSFFRFYWDFLEVLMHTRLPINSAGSVSKTSDTWWQYRYLPPTCKYRQYRYLQLVLVLCPSLLITGETHLSPSPLLGDATENIWAKIKLITLKFLHSRISAHANGVDKGGGKGGLSPPNELKDHPCEKMKSEEKLRGGGRWLCVILKSKMFFCKFSPAKCRKSHFRYSRFQNFPGEHAPGPP